jgi:nucleoside recognition membrane protein YjiH
MNAGGGIHATTKATREATEEELLTQSRKRLDQFLRHGVTTVEAKSGYGLTLEHELKQLIVAKKLHETHPVDVVRTFMGAHAVPIEFKDNPDEFVRIVVEKMIPKVSELGLAEFNDVFSVLKVLGLIVAAMLLFNVGPSWLLKPNMGPFLYDKLVISVGLLVPIGSVFLALLVGYGLLEFVGVWMQPVMRPIWKTPGRSTIDAVASFVGSYSLGLLITNKVFKEGKYTIKEAAIIATGFSTVSVTFMVVVAKTLGLMDIWNTYFWVTFFVTFLVTAITVRIWPLSKMSDDYDNGKGQPEKKVTGNYMKEAWSEAMKAVQHSKGLLQNVWVNLKDGFIMTMSILPSIMSVGLIGLLLAEYTPVFDIIGYIFYPFTLLLQIPEPLLAAKAAAMEIAEMFLPALLVTEARSSRNLLLRSFPFQRFCSSQL